ncbi:MAG: hypothetical protein D6696_09225 [Acidobacteria bacterium]|nr:MAG: hypothetical protein D6696_09225 [Acidobacteriota bacterium]
MAEHDGRFGARFDDEISTRRVVEVLIGVGAITAVAMVLMLIFWRVLSAELAAAPAAAPALIEPAARELPPEPRLQASPEAELQQLRREMDQRTSSYGWVDEAAGMVHIPVDEAINVLLERGLNAPAASAGDGAAAAAGEETP